MEIVTSISGGKTSAYLAANYPSDHNVFALVRIEDNNCRYPDTVLRKRVEDRIQAPFIGTLEDDTIIYTIFDLEQYLGKEINWVTGMTFEALIKMKSGFLPNRVTRYCTTWLKMYPIFYWWAEKIGKPVIMYIGYRANEKNRVKKAIEKVDGNGLSTIKATFGKNKQGKNKWEMVAWRKPVFPLYNERIYRDTINEFWLDKSVRFAKFNNCVGCFHRNPLMLRKMFDEHPNKMEWFSSREGGEKNAQWRPDVSYMKIKEHQIQFELDWDNFSECDSGYCGI